MDYRTQLRVLGLISCSLCIQACAEAQSDAPAGMAHIPAAEVWVGCTTELESTCGANEGPRVSLQLAPFAIDIHEVTVSEYVDFLNTKGNQCGEHECAESFFEHSPVVLEAGAWVPRDPLKGDHPMAAVSWYGAEAYCAHVSKRLCSEFEWETAALGTCAEGNCEASKPTFPWGEAQASCAHAHMFEGEKGCGTDTTAAVGSYPAGVSPFGVHDMAGNVWEWVADTWREDYATVGGDAASPWVDPSVPFRVVRGGGLGSGPDRVRSSHRFNAGASDKPAEYGFRCCQ